MEERCRDEILENLVKEIIYDLEDEFYRVFDKVIETVFHISYIDSEYPSLAIDLHFGDDRFGIYFGVDDDFDSKKPFECSAGDYGPLDSIEEIRKVILDYFKRNGVQKPLNSIQFIKN